MSRHRSPRRRRYVALALAVVTAVLLSLFTWHLFTADASAEHGVPAVAQSTPTTMPSPNPSISPTPLATTVSQKPTQSSSCVSTQGAFEPARLIYPRLGINVEVLPQPLKVDDSLPDPPFGVPGLDAANSASWYNQGAQPGAGSGTVYLGVHTYHNKQAVGNKLGNGAKSGDDFWLQDVTGKQKACFVVTTSLRLESADKPALPEAYRSDGPAGAAFNFCWDEEADWGKWLLRGYVFASAM